MYFAFVKFSHRVSLGSIPLSLSMARTSYIVTVLLSSPILHPSRSYPLGSDMQVVSSCTLGMSDCVDIGSYSPFYDILLLNFEFLIYVLPLGG